MGQSRRAVWFLGPSRLWESDRSSLWFSYYHVRQENTASWVYDDDLSELTAKCSIEVDVLKM